MQLLLLLILLLLLLLLLLFLLLLLLVLLAAELRNRPKALPSSRTLSTTRSTEGSVSLVGVGTLIAGIDAGFCGFRLSCVGFGEAGAEALQKLVLDCVSKLAQRARDFAGDRA